MTLAPATWVAAGAWAGALLAAAVPGGWAAGAVVAGVGLRTRRVWLLVVGALLVTSASAAAAERGLAPLAEAPYRGEVTVLSDPRTVGGALRLDVRIGRHRVEAWARGPAAARLRPRLTGERVVLTGRLTPPPAEAPWLARRHVVGRLSVAEVGEWRPGDPASRAANGLRRTLASGAEVLDHDTRGLYAGLLLGDQRDQSPVVADAFVGSGLSHLLAVSGQNVAFVLVVAGPLLRRMRLGSRLVATLAILAFFALVTRFEPSVLRATTMAGLAATAVTFGREADSRRMLALAVTTLLVVDPLIATHLAFQLSVAATTGILLWANPLAARLPGPRPVAEAIGVTVAAQAAVSPLLVPTFGGMPVAALLANVLAAPVAGPVVTWGLPAGLVAGVAGDGLAQWLHAPTSLMVGWIAGIARLGARLPLGEVRVPHLLVLGVGVLLVWGARTSLPRGPLMRALGALLVVAAVVHPAWVARRPPPLVSLVDGTTVHVAGSAVVVELDRGARADVVLEGLRRASVRHVDVVVARHGGRDVAEAVAALRERHPPRLVLAPPGHRVPQGSVAREGSTVEVGELRVEVREVTTTLVVEVGRAEG